MTIPSYPDEPIASYASLCLALGISQQELLKLISKSDSYFFITNVIVKPDKSLRETFDVKPELKKIHERICNVFFRKVKYPYYLQGSIKKRDYLSNCSSHTNQKLIISEDVTNFFPSISEVVVHQMWVGVFRFSNEVAKALTNLVCYEGWLVQGAKPSSFICNLILWKREAYLVESLEKQGLTYTRYVDDITVSSPTNLSKSTIATIIQQIFGMLASVNVKPNRKKHKVVSNAHRQDVHRVNVNSLSPTLPKIERHKITAAVYQCEAAFINELSKSEYETMFNKAMGRVNNLKRMHLKQGKELVERLRLIKPCDKL